MLLSQTDLHSNHFLETGKISHHELLTLRYTFGTLDGESVSHREGLVHISNPVDGLETGGHFSLKTICPPDFVREDAQIHPYILFGNCRLLKKNHPFSEPKLKLSAMAGKCDSIKSVVFTLASWRHIFLKHSITFKHLQIK